MFLLHTLSIRAKLVGAFSVLLALLVGLGLLSPNALTTIHTQTVHMADDWLPGLYRAAIVRAA